jgi:4-amino-4-deoxy-L-arabinose transferase-like glycosyltransferase
MKRWAIGKEILNREFSPAITRNILVAIIIAAALIRILWVLYNGTEISTAGDAGLYHRLALSLSSGNGYSINGYVPYHRPPGYVFLLTLFYFFAPYVITGIIVNIVLGVASVFLIFLLGKEFFGTTVGLVSSAILAVHPLAIGISHLLITENLSIFLAIIFVLLLMQAFHRPNITGILYSVFSGISLGFLILARPVFQTTILFLPFIIYLIIRSLKRTVLISLLVIVACVLTISPWTIHNYRSYGKLIPVSTWGTTFACSNTPYLLENEEYHGWWIPVFPGDYLTEKEKGELTPNDYWDLNNDEILKRAAFRFILNHPSEELSIVWYKVLFLLVPRAKANSLPNIIYLVSYYIFLALTLCGVIFWIRIGGREFIVILSLIVPYILSEIVFFPCIRYSIPIQPFLMVLSALALVMIFKIKKPA